MRKDTPGKIFHRMVDTVLARDKNWVYWKMAGCPPIQRDSVSPYIWAEAQASAKRSTTNKRLRPIPLNAVSMDFLEEKDTETVMNELKDPTRFRVPDLYEFKSKISDTDFEISMAASSQAKAQAVATKASQSWRVMRIARGFKLAAFDKIDDSNDINAIFEPLEDVDAATDEEQTASAENMPASKETIIVSGPTGVGKSAVIEKLQESHVGVFGRVVRHTTREPIDGEVKGKTYHFVQPQEFNQLRDGDRFVEYTEQGDVAYGTSSKAIEAVTESGKVPIIEMDMDVCLISTPTRSWLPGCDANPFCFSHQAAKFAKDMMDFPARYILLKTQTPDALRSRLQDAAVKDDAAVQAILDSLAAQLDDPKVAEIFSKTFVIEGLEDGVKAVSEYLFESGEEAHGDKMEANEEPHAEAKEDAPAHAPAKEEQMDIDSRAE